MSKRYLIKLHPTDAFFFGGETTFGAGISRNYLAHSEDFPQQTTLLGMLRYQVLAQHGQIPITDKLLAKTLIGPESFRVDGKGEFGKILALSPVFLMHDAIAYRPNPLDDKYDEKEKTLHHQPLLPTTTPGKAYLSGRTLDAIPALDGYDHKAHYQECFVAAEGNPIYKKSEVLRTDERVGIQKGRDGHTLTDAFFRQTVLRFPSRQWAFAFYADLDVELGDAFVTLGGEQSLFQLKVHPITTQPTGTPTDAFKARFGIEPVADHPRIELLSDAYASTALYDHCQLAYTDTISFRGIRTQVDTTAHYHNRPDKTERLELIRRGSVLWSRDPAQTTAALRKPEFEAIGYNAFYTGPRPAHPSTQPDS